MAKKHMKRYNIISLQGNTNQNHNHVVITWMIIIKKREWGGDKVLVRMWRNLDLFMYSQWECEMVHPLWKTVWHFLKKLSKFAQSCNAIPRYVPKRIKNMHSNKYMYKHVHSSTINNSQRMKIGSYGPQKKKKKKK